MKKKTPFEEAMQNVTLKVEGNKLIMKSPGVIVPMTGATSIVDIELTKAQ